MRWSCCKLREREKKKRDDGERAKVGKRRGTRRDKMKLLKVKEIRSKGEDGGRGKVSKRRETRVNGMRLLKLRGKDL